MTIKVPDDQPPRPSRCLAHSLEGLPVEDTDNRFRDLAEAIPQIVWTARPDGSVDYCNRRWYEYTGLKSPDETRTHWRQALHPDDLAAMLPRWRASLTNGEPLDQELRIKPIQSDDYRWHLIRAIPVRAPQGQVRQWFGTATDIQDQKLAIEMRDEFMNLASHELKTPITSLRLQLQLSQRQLNVAPTPDPQKLAKSLNTALRQVDRLAELVERLLDMSRIQADRLTMHFQPVHPARLVEQAIQPHLAQLQARPHALHLNLAADLTARWDAPRIIQVVQNLVANALQHAPGEPVIIQASAAADRCLIQVQDRGPGISVENQDRIFERFERATALPSMSGLGLGLFISHRIVAAHRGRIHVDSELGRGSTFCVELPLDPRLDNGS